MKAYIQKVYTVDNDNNKRRLQVCEAFKLVKTDIGAYRKVIKDKFKAKQVLFIYNS